MAAAALSSVDALVNHSAGGDIKKREWTETFGAGDGAGVAVDGPLSDGDATPFDAAAAARASIGGTSTTPAPGIGSFVRINAAPPASKIRARITAPSRASLLVYRGRCEERRRGFCRTSAPVARQSGIHRT